MSKKVYAFSAALLTLSFLFFSCDNSNDNDTTIDEEWKVMNEKAFAAKKNDSSYERIYSASEEGYIFMKDTSAIKDSDKSLKITATGTPQFTDTVVVRYEGWIFNKEGKKVLFDSTEKQLTANGANPNKRPIKYSVHGVIDGWTTALQRMKEGDEKVICIPWNLGYGSRASTAIPAYSTLYFDVLLVKIIPMESKTQ